jgi:hypothetical protein
MADRDTVVGRLSLVGNLPDQRDVVRGQRRRQRMELSAVTYLARDDSVTGSRVKPNG